MGIDALCAEELWTMIEQGLVLMGAGMGVVAVFLTTMVIIMYIAAAFFKKYAHLFKDKKPGTPPRPKKPVRKAVSTSAKNQRPKAQTGSKKGIETDDAVEIAVAIAAVKAHAGN